MNRQTAVQVLDLMYEASRALDQSATIVMKNCEQEEFHQFRRYAGRAMGEIFVEIMSPIFKEYPDLMPDELKSSAPPVQK